MLGEKLDIRLVLSFAGENVRLSSAKIHKLTAGIYPVHISPYWDGDL